MRLIKTIIWCFLINCVRDVTSRIIYLLFKPFQLVENPGKWLEVSAEKDIEKFAEVISKFQYKSDPMGGILDYTQYNLDVFFNTEEHSSDCDDFAWLYFQWAKRHNHKAWYVAINNGLSLKRGHFVTVIKIAESYFLCNYSIAGKYKNLEESIKQFEIRELVLGGKYDDIVWCVNENV